MHICMCASAQQQKHLAVAVALHHALAEGVVPQPLLQARAVGAGAIKAATGLLAAEGARYVPDEVPGLCQPLADTSLQARQEGAALMRWQEARACIRCASASEAELSARELVCGASPGAAVVPKPFCMEHTVVQLVVLNVLAQSLALD